jgi:hypothetical protein
MAIKVYPTEIEGVDDDGRKIFTASLFDEFSATITMNAVIGINDNTADAFSLLRTEK